MIKIYLLISLNFCFVIQANGLKFRCPSYICQDYECIFQNACTVTCLAQFETCLHKADLEKKTLIKTSLPSMLKGTQDIERSSLFLKSIQSFPGH